MRTSLISSFFFVNSKLIIIFLYASPVKKEINIYNIFILFFRKYIHKRTHAQNTTRTTINNSNMQLGNSNGHLSTIFVQFN